MKAIGIMSVKGGVGKTVIALSLAKSLAKRLYKVGFIDADLDNSNFSQFTNVEGNIEIDKSKRFKLYEWNGIKVFSMSLLVGRDKGVSMTSDRYVQMLSDAVEYGDWNCDMFVVDMPSGSSDIWKGVLTIFGNVYAGSIIVTQPITTDAFVKSLRVHKYYDIPVIGVVENMAYFECEHGQKYFIFGEGRTEEIAEEFNVPFLGRIPIISKLTIPIQDDVIDDIVNAAINAQIMKTSFLERFKEVAWEKVKEQIEKVLLTILIKIQREIDLKDMQIKTGFTEERPFLLSITNESGELILTRVPMKIKDGKIIVLKNPGKLDYEIALSAKTFANIILDKIDAWDAWLCGDIKVYGAGFTPRAVKVLREVFSNKEFIEQIRDKYRNILEVLAK